MLFVSPTRPLAASPLARSESTPTKPPATQISRSIGGSVSQSVGRSVSQSVSQSVSNYTIGCSTTNIKSKSAM